MISNFKSVVASVAGARKVEILGSMDDKIWDLDKKLDRGEIKIDQAISSLRGVFSGKLTSDDYRKIKHEIELNLQ